MYSLYALLMRHEDSLHPYHHWERLTDDPYPYVNVCSRLDTIQTLISQLDQPPFAAQAYEDLALLEDPESLPALLAVNPAQIGRDSQTHQEVLISLMLNTCAATPDQIKTWVASLGAEPHHIDKLLTGLGTEAAQQVVIDYWSESPLFRGHLSTLEALPQEEAHALHLWTQLVHDLEGPRLQRWITELWPERPQLALILALHLKHNPPTWLGEAIVHPHAIAFLAHYAQQTGEQWSLGFPLFHCLHSHIPEPERKRQFAQLARKDRLDSLALNLTGEERRQGLLQAIQERSLTETTLFLYYQLLDAATLAQLTATDRLWLRLLNFAEYPVTDTAPEEWLQLSPTEQLDFLAHNPLRYTSHHEIPGWIRHEVQAAAQSQDPKVQAAYQVLQQEPLFRLITPCDQRPLPAQNEASDERADQRSEESAVEKLQSLLDQQQQPDGEISLSPAVLAELQRRWAEATTPERRKLLLQVIPRLDYRYRQKMQAWFDWAQANGETATLMALTPVWLLQDYTRLALQDIDPLPEIRWLHEGRLWEALMKGDPRLKQWVHLALTTSRWQSVRRVALYCFGCMSPAHLDATLYAAVLQVLTEGNSKERIAAAGALLQRPHPDWVPVLQQRCQQEPLDEVRHMIGQALSMAYTCQSRFPTATPKAEFPSPIDAIDVELSLP